jgi:hypothetical protein
MSIGAIIALSLFLSISVAAQGHGPVLNRVSVGGHDADLSDDGFDRDANYSFIAIQYVDGFVRGQFIDRYYNDVTDPGNGGGLRGEITCLHINGNMAWVTGNVSSGSSNLYFWSRVVDNGTSNADLPDEVGFGLTFNNPFLLDCSLELDEGDNPNFFSVYPMPDGQVKIN